MSKSKPETSSVDALIEASAAVMHLYGEGLSNTQISERTKVPLKKVREIVASSGVPTRDPGRRIYVDALKKQAAKAREDAENPARLLNPAAQPAPIKIVPDKVSAADQYQMFVASEGARLLKDSLPSIRPPRTVKELGELDQIIRRNLGLGGKPGGGSGKLSIDISVLCSPTGSDPAPAVEAQEAGEE